MKKGFANMDPERQKEIAAQGGRAAQATGRGRRWTSEEAREAGRKGGLARQRKKSGSQEHSTPDEG